MNDSAAHPDELQNLLAELIDGEMTPEQHDRLSSMLRDDPEARQCYLRCVMLHARLKRKLGRTLATEVRPWADDAADRPRVTVRGNPSVSLPPTFGVLGGAWHGTVNYFSQVGPLSYLIATCIMFVMGVVASNWKVPNYAQVARQSLSPASVGQHGIELRSELVGRITGMVDCQWEEGSGVRGQGSGLPSPAGRGAGGEGGSDGLHPSSLIPHPSSLVRLGDKYALSSGLMEITYDTGAKVVLQGPVTYQVESRNGGFLSVGKLTARVDKKGSEFSGQGSEISKTQDPRPKTQVPSPNPLFAVRTPTATVTDLGTEFGVEVAKDGVCEVHVLKGRVQTQFFSSSGRTIQVVQLKEGEARRHQGASDQVSVIAADRTKFERMRIGTPDDRRQRWLAYSQQLRKDPALVAYYTFEPVGGSTSTLPNLSAAGSELDGQVDGAEWVYGRLPGKFALYFHGPGSGDKVVLPKQERFKFTGPFSLAVWFNIDRFTLNTGGLVTKGHESWRLHQFGDNPRLISFDTDWDPPQNARSKTEVASNGWHLAVAVYEPGQAVAHRQLYIDGRLDAENNSPLPVIPLSRSDHAVWLGAKCTIPGQELSGLIDEVAILARALSADEVMAMFQAGNPARKVSTEPSKGK